MMWQASAPASRSVSSSISRLQADDDLYDDFGLDGRETPLRQASTDAHAVGPLTAARTASIPPSSQAASDELRRKSSEVPAFQAGTVEGSGDMTAEEAVQVVGRALHLGEGASPVQPGEVTAAVSELLQAHQRCRQQLHAEQRKQLACHVQVRNGLCCIGSTCSTDS
jgi:hypothetical protein